MAYWKIYHIKWLLWNFLYWKKKKLTLIILLRHSSATVLTSESESSVKQSRVSIAKFNTWGAAFTVDREISFVKAKQLAIFSFFL